MFDIKYNLIKTGFEQFTIFSSSVRIGFTWFEQFIDFVSSNSFAAKSVEQVRVEQSQFEQFTPTHCLVLLPSYFF